MLFVTNTVIYKLTLESKLPLHRVTVEHLIISNLPYYIIYIYIITTSAQDNQEHSNWRSRGEAHSLGPRATRQGVVVVWRGGGGQGQRCRLAAPEAGGGPAGNEWRRLGS